MDPCGAEAPRNCSDSKAVPLGVGQQPDLVDGTKIYLKPSYSDGLWDTVDTNELALMAAGVLPVIEEQYWIVPEKESAIRLNIAVRGGRYGCSFDLHRNWPREFWGTP